MGVAGKKSENVEEGRSSQVRLFCIPCQEENSKIDATGACRECEEYMGDTCFRHHLKGKLCRNHVLVAISDLPSIASQSSEEDIENCKKHGNEVIKFYCRTHEVVGCGDCIILEHTACKPEYIQDLAKTFRKEETFKQLFQKVDLMESFEKESTLKMEKRKKEIDALNEKALTGIRQFRSEINAHLDKAEAEITSEVTKVTSENNEQYRKLEKDVRSLIEDIEDIKKKLDQQHHSRNVAFIHAVTCKPEVEKIEKTYEHVKQNNFFKRFEFVRGEEISKIVRSAHGFGRLQIEPCKVETGVSSAKKVDVGAGIRYNNAFLHDFCGDGSVTTVYPDGRVNVIWTNQGEHGPYTVGKEGDVSLI